MQDVTQVRQDSPNEMNIDAIRELLKRWGNLGEVMKAIQSTYHRLELIPRLHPSEAPPGGEHTYRWHVQHGGAEGQ